MIISTLFNCCSRGSLRATLAPRFPTYNNAATAISKPTSDTENGVRVPSEPRVGDALEKRDEVIKLVWTTYPR